MQKNDTNILKKLATTLRVIEYIQGPQTKNYQPNPQIIIDVKDSAMYGRI